MDAFNKTLLLEAADGFEKHGLKLPPIWLNKSMTERGHYAWGGHYGCLQDYHVCVSSKFENALLALFHERQHLIPNRESGRIVEGKSIEGLVTRRAK